MKIYIIGKTGGTLQHEWNGRRTQAPGKAGGSAFDERIESEAESYGRWNGQTLIEFAGRLCYESWDLPNENTATNDKYIQNIVKQGHESVLEHASVTFYVEGVSRNLSHELIRHRHLSFSELSQRFVNMEDGRFISPPGLGGGESDLWHFTQDYADAMLHAEAGGLKGKKAREAARAYLPGGTETKFVVTGNLRAWRDVLKKRDSEHADAEMQLFAKEIKRQLLEEYPDVFKDLANEDS